MNVNDPCPRCKTGRMKRYRTLTEDNRRVKYFKCYDCGRTAAERFIWMVDRDGVEKFLPGRIAWQLKAERR